MKSLGLVMGVLVVGALVGCGDDTGGSGGGAQGGGGSGGGTTTSSTTSTSDGGGGEGGGATGATCASYCASVGANCTAGNLQYADEAQCLAACAAFEQGEPGATSGNSLECRQYHADFASNDPATHCVHAGPLGTGACEGTNGSCDGFCAIAMAECSNIYETLNDCLTDCALNADDVVYHQGVTTGDNLACRMYHLTVAIAAPDPHCEHIQSTDATCAD
jgi:hypothetical protein